MSLIDAAAAAQHLHAKIIVQCGHAVAENLRCNHGAFRSAFLIKAGLSKESFVGTNAVSTVIVDTVRLATYGAAFHTANWSVLPEGLGSLIASATLVAFAGAFLGSRLLKKVTLKFIQYVVAATMVVVGAGLASGML